MIILLPFISRSCNGRPGARDIRYKWTQSDKKGPRAKVAGRAVTRGVVKIMMAVGAAASLVVGTLIFAFPASASR